MATRIQQMRQRYDEFTGATSTAPRRTGPTTDDSERLPVMHVWRWEGDEIRRLQVVTDTLQAARLLG